MVAIFLIVILSLKNFDNSQKLTIVGVIPYFYKNHLSQKKRYYMLLAQIDFSDYLIKTSFGSQLT